MTRYELLAPAKDLECGIAAINCGADAVYLGAPRFGARENAGNSVEDIASLVRHAHTYWAKVYVTLNTLLSDDELPHAVRLIGQLHDAGIDGLIIQDTGLLECDLPPIPLIASTQMHNTTPEKVAFLEKVGFQRVILARELSLDQIAEIRLNTNVGLECFVHGALCVCYSGQCYLSYAFGKRSGNRGHCAQPCRKLYTLQDRTGKTLISDRHFLSLRDMNRSANLKELIDAGITSFKIEGRLKDKNYITNVVSHYRQELDSVLEGCDGKRSSSGKSIIDFTPDTKKTFNRGYTTYFLHGPAKSISWPHTPKMVGEPVGTVVTTSARTFTLDNAFPLHNGDGLCFFDSQHELRGATVNGVQGCQVLPSRMDGIEKGTRLFRNHDHEFLTALEKSRVERQIAVTFRLREEPKGFRLTVTDEDGCSASISYPCDKVRAEKPEQARANIEKQLKKTGGTAFSCNDVYVELATAYFIPVSTLNTLRREALEQLCAEREKQRPVRTGKVLKNSAVYPERTLSYLGNVMNKRAEAFYWRHGVVKIEPAAETGVNMRGKKLMTTKYCLRRELGICRKVREIPSDPLYLVDEEDHRLEIQCDCTRCEMNIYWK